MPLSLHAALVPGWLQILRSCRVMVERAGDHCAQHGLDQSELVEARLHEGMRPFKYQLKSCTVHTRGAVEQARTGQAGPDLNKSPATFEGMSAQLDGTIAFLEALAPSDLETLVGREVVFTIPMGESRRYAAQDFLLGFSRPNFYFHAVSAYAVLRMKGVNIGKVDYLGVWPVKG